MREILFRGKRLGDGEWVEGGGFLWAYDTCWLYGRLNREGDWFDDWVKVIPETVGQYTGLKDKNGKKIFEGDIVRNRDYTMIVVWYDFHAAFMLAFRVDGDYFETISNSHIYLEIIGNIHDTP